MSEKERKQKARENAKRYYEKNKEKVLKRQKEYAKKRYREDEEFRNKIKEKNRNYVINNPKKAREIKRKSQHKYITKKRLSGELPLTQKMLIEQLQQRIDKAIKVIESYNLGKYDYSIPSGGITELLEVLKSNNKQLQEEE